MQAEGELRKICKYTDGVRVLAVYGGDPITGQIRQLKRGVEIVVGTPGRVMDLMRRHALDLESLSLAVLDEADEMLNMGFREDIETILQTTPPTRQTVLFSATMPPEILEITGEYQHMPALIEAGNTAERTIDTISQYYFEVPRGEKERALTLLLHAQQPRLSIIFCNTKKMVDELGRCLSEHGFQASALHGDMKQDMRTSVMNSFKSGRTPILIATDVAARGIDVDDVDAVYNFDIPQDFEYYIHRIGRTGRAGRTGASYTLIDSPRQISIIRSIERFTHAKIERKPLPDYHAIAAQRSEKLCDSLRTALLEKNNGVASRFSAHPILEALTADGYTTEMVAEIALEHLLHHEMASIPEIHAPKPEKPAKAAPLHEGCVRLRVSIGRSRNVAPNHIVGAITEATGISGKRIGKIQCFREYSLMEIPGELAQRIIHKLSGHAIGGPPPPPPWRRQFQRQTIPPPQIIFYKTKRYAVLYRVPFFCVLLCLLSNTWGLNGRAKLQHCNTQRNCHNNNAKCLVLCPYFHKKPLSPAVFLYNIIIPLFQTFDKGLSLRNINKLLLRFLYILHECNF